MDPFSDPFLMKLRNYDSRIHAMRQAFKTVATVDEQRVLEYRRLIIERNTWEFRNLERWWALPSPPVGDDDGVD